MEIQVIKKDGSSQPYNQNKIERVTLAAGLKPEEGKILAEKVTAQIKMLQSDKIESATIRNLVSQELSKINQFAAGTRQSSRTTSEVWEACTPIFFHTVPSERPGVPFSMAKAQRPPHFLLLSSVAKTT